MEDETATWAEHRAGGPALHVRAVRLEVIGGPDVGLAKTFTAQTVVIGRANADFQLDDKLVSALHAEIRLEPQGFRLRDLGSTNGTHAGGVKLLDAFLTSGVVITLGDTSIRFTPLALSNELPLASMQRLGGLVGGAPAMRRMYALIERFAKTDATVLVTGETGTGKELVAEAIHASSRRKDAPFVVLDCRSLAQVSGQLSGAFEAAQGGTLFLDEIGELPLEDQPRLLRAIETKSDTDVRIVAATSRDLAVEVNRERFRPDLYFRLAVARIHAPPLREHREDIDALVEHFVAASGGGQLSASFKDHARSHPWPGNVRELRSAVEQALVLGDRPELATQQWSSSLAVDVSVPFKEAKRRILDELEKKYITELIEAHDGNVSAAARAADLDRMTIYKLLRRAGLREPK